MIRSLGISSSSAGTYLVICGFPRFLLPYKHKWLSAFLLAADPGFEPGFRVPETRVLPLHQSASVCGKKLSLIPIAEYGQIGSLSKTRHILVVGFKMTMSNLISALDCNVWNVTNLVEVN